MENYLGGSSKALQFVIDALMHVRDKRVSAGCAFWTGGAEQIPTNFLLHFASIVHYGDWRAIRTPTTIDNRITANLATAIWWASRNISLQGSLSELQRSSSGGDVTMKDHP
jgi:hypothetical protein